MSDDDFGCGFVFGLVLAALVLAFSSVTDHVTFDHMQIGVDLCAPHEGLANVERSNYFTGSYEVHCRNGIDIMVKGERGE